LSLSEFAWEKEETVYAMGEQKKTNTGTLNQWAGRVQPQNVSEFAWGNLANV